MPSSLHIFSVLVFLFVSVSSGAVRRNAQTDYVNVTLVTPINTMLYDYCNTANLLPKASWNPSSVAVNGQLLGSSCVMKGTCSILLETSKIEQGLIFVTSELSSSWFFQLRVNDVVLEPTDYDCYQASFRELSFYCTCGDHLSVLYPIEYLAFNATPAITVPEEPPNGEDEGEGNDNQVAGDKDQFPVGLVAGVVGAAAVLLGVAATILVRRNKSSQDNGSYLIPSAVVIEEKEASVQPKSTRLKSPITGETLLVTPIPLNVVDSSAVSESNRKLQRHRSKLVKNFNNFYSTTPKTDLGTVLKTRFSTVTFNTNSTDPSAVSSFLSRKTKSTGKYDTISVEEDLSSIDVSSYKTSVSHKDEHRFTKLKESIRFTSAGSSSLPIELLHKSHDKQLTPSSSTTASTSIHHHHKSHKTDLSSLPSTSTSSSTHHHRHKSHQTELTKKSIHIRGAMKSAQLVRTSEQLYGKTKELIDLVCLKLSKETLDEHESKTDFYSGSEIPMISIDEYLYRLVKGLDKWFYDEPSTEAVGVRSLLISLIYLENIKSKEPNFVLTVYNVHRIFSVMMLLAAKFTEDCLIVNSYWSKVSGLALDDLNDVEEEFCRAAGFDFWVTNDQLQQLYDEFKLGKLLRNSLNSVV